jgi:hypothetical protein
VAVYDAGAAVRSAVAALDARDDLDGATVAYLRVAPLLVRCAPGYAALVARGGAADPLTLCVDVARFCGPGGTLVVPNTTADAYDDSTCACYAGFSGERCEQCTDPALMPPFCNATWSECARARCSGRGHCVEPSACACDAAWTGRSCSVQMAVCATLNCSNFGVCTDTPGVCNCSAASGYVGADCSIDARSCGRVLCSARGNCTSSMRCACDAGYTGAQCDRLVVYNGGVAHPVDPLESPAVCPAGFTGFRCETDVCGANAGRGVWNADLGACVCVGVWAENTDGTLPVCSANRCGRGTPHGTWWCACEGSGTTTLYNPTPNTEWVCDPLPPVYADSVTYNARDWGTGADTSHGARVPLLVVALVCAATLSLATLMMSLRNTAQIHYRRA